jgi:hypothetical protein
VGVRRRLRRRAKNFAACWTFTDSGKTQPNFRRRGRGEGRAGARRRIKAIDWEREKQENKFFLIFYGKCEFFEIFVGD